MYYLKSNFCTNLKHWVLILFAGVLYTGPLMAGEHPYDDHPDTTIMTMEEYRDSVFGALDFSEVTSGILTDLAMAPYPVWEIDSVEEVSKNKL